MARCTAARADGSPCRAQAGPSGFCWAHDPALAERRREARRAGGRAAHRPVATLPACEADLPLESAADALATLGTVVNGVLRGRIDPKVANSAIYGLATLLRGRELGEFEQRLAALERQLAERRRP